MMDEITKFINSGKIMKLNEVIIKDEQLIQLEVLHQETSVEYSDIINGAINEYFNNFMARLKRLEGMKVVK